jgi:hypothetical protein
LSVDERKTLERWTRRHNLSQALGLRSRIVLRQLAADINAWVANWNESPTTYVWRKTAEQILECLAGYYGAINGVSTEMTPTIFTALHPYRTRAPT